MISSFHLLLLFYSSHFEEDWPSNGELKGTAIYIKDVFWDDLASIKILFYSTAVFWFELFN